MNYPEIFTPEERDENEERKRELIELIVSGEAVLIVGAGSSVRVGYVTWNALIEALENLANNCGEGLDQRHKGDPLAYTEDIKSHIISKTGDLRRYYALLQDLFSPKNPPFDDFHRKLVSLPFRGILTTNYDIVLEAALGELEPRSAHDNSLVIDENSAGRVHEFLMAMNNDKRMTRRIAHLHGKFDIPKNIILSIEDYHNVYGLRLPANQGQRHAEWTLHRKLLWSVLATRRVVFVGFSMEDPYFENMLETVSEDLWGWDKSVHFAIMSISPEGVESSKSNAERLKKEYGVDTIFYEVLENEIPEEKYKLLDSLFADIAKQYASESRSIEETQAQSGDSERSEGEESKTISSESGSILNWLKRESRRMIRRIGDED